MRTCARGLPLRSGALLLLLVPTLLLALQLLVVGTRLPRAAQVGLEEQEVAFSVISIEPERNTRQWGSPSRRAGQEEEEEKKRAYEDENEMHSRQVSSIKFDFNVSEYFHYC